MLLCVDEQEGFQSGCVFLFLLLLTVVSSMIAGYDESDACKIKEAEKLKILMTRGEGLMEA